MPPLKDAKKRHQNIPASYLVLMDDNKTLLLRRFNTGYEDGNYSLISGHVEEGEHFTKTIIREAEEEAGIVVKPHNLKVAHVMHRNAADSERIDVFFVAEAWEGEVGNKEPHKCDDLSWFDLDDLPENVIPYIRQALGGIKNGMLYSEIGW